MELETEAKKLVDYINSLGLQIPRRKPSHKHIGAIIADAVLQIGHRYETHVGPRAEGLRKNYPEAATISGFLRLLKTVGARKLIDWEGANLQKAIYDHAKFFASEGIETFPNLYKWLGPEENRDRLITELPEIDGIGRIGDKTADYYRVLVRHPDAVKVDSRVKEFLTYAGINIRKYEYKELRTIVQLAAKQLKKKPIDLEGAIWDYQGKRNKEETEMDAKKITYLPIGDARRFAVEEGLKKESEQIDDTAEKEVCIIKLNREYTRALHMKLFQFRNVWDKFIRKHWPEVNQDQRCGKEALKRYERRAKEAFECWPQVEDILVGQLDEQSFAVPLSIERRAQLEKLARECHVDAPTLAKIWIIDHLQWLNKD